MNVYTWFYFHVLTVSSNKDYWIITFVGLWVVVLSIHLTPYKSVTLYYSLNLICLTTMCVVST